MELRHRRGLMITLIVVTVGIPTVFLAVRLLLHAVAPKTYGPAGGYDSFTSLTAGVLYTFGFIVAAALGATAGSVDLSEGMFRHLVVTGRSRLALYLARIPAGLAIIGPLIAIGFTIICAVCVYAAPRNLDLNGVSVPAGLSQTQLESWAADHANEVLCQLPSNNISVNFSCGPAPRGPIRPGGPIVKRAPGKPVTATATQLRAAAVQVAQQNWTFYQRQFRVPSRSLMVKTGLWIELEAAIGFLVGLGLGSLLGQRTVAVVLLIVLEIVLTPIVIRVRIPHFENLQRAVVGVATAHLEPGQLPLAFGGGGRDFRLTESTTTAILVILAWVIGWSVIGAWRMMTRDA
jgi:type IV secretory pathway protease TraF